MSQRSDTETCEERDWGRDPRAALRAWGPPILLIVMASFAEYIPAWPQVASDLIWSGCIFWIALSCLLNARQCGRFHCSVLALVYPLLGLVALGMTFGWVQFPWNPFWVLFSLITILAFIPEFFGVQYIGARANNAFQK